MIKKEKIKLSIIKLLRKRKKIKYKDIDNFDFVISKHLDSFELLEFNMELENKFNINLTNKEIQSKKFSKVNGLTDIIFKKIN